jgi:hypothetical protein
MIELQSNDSSRHHRRDFRDERDGGLCDHRRRAASDVVDLRDTAGVRATVDGLLPTPLAS